PEGQLYSSSSTMTFSGDSMKQATMLFTFFLSLSAFGSEAVDADYFCEQNGGGIAFKLPTRYTPARVWQIDAGIEEGLEVSLTNFSTARCPGCWSFKGNVMGLPVRGTVSKFVLKYEAFGSF